MSHFKSCCYCFVCILCILIIIHATSSLSNGVDAETIYSNILRTNPTISKLDTILNSTYRNAISILDKNQSNELKKSQREWIKSRNITLLNLKSKIDLLHQQIAQVTNLRISEINKIISENKNTMVLIEVSVVGKLNVGTLDSGILCEGNNDIGFITKSDIGDIIFASCSDGEVCKVVGFIEKDDPYRMIKSIVKADRVPEKHDISTDQPSESCNNSIEESEKLTDATAKDLNSMDFCSACKHSRKALALMEYIDNNNCYEKQGSQAVEAHRSKTAGNRMISQLNCNYCQQ